jgi:hypothetical protein
MTMYRFTWTAVLALLFAGCVTVPRVGDMFAASLDCEAAPLGFAVAGAKAIHACPLVSSADGSPGAFVEVEQGIVRAILDRHAAKAWVVSNRCSSLGIETNDSKFAACEELVSDMLLLWDAVEVAEERAMTAEQDLQRADFQHRAKMQQVLTTGLWYEW